jgi:hypothetical protein
MSRVAFAVSFQAYTSVPVGRGLLLEPVGNIQCRQTEGGFKMSDVRCPYCDYGAPYGDFVTKGGYKCPRCKAGLDLRLGQLLPLGLYPRQRKQEKSEEGREDHLRRIEEMVAGNAEVLNETYESVQKLRKAVAIVQTLQEEQLENPHEQMKKVGLRHEEWDGKSPHPYGCVEQLDGDPDDAGDGGIDQKSEHLEKG